MNLRYALLTALCCLLTFTLSAQERFSGDLECGTVGKSAWLTKYQRGQIPRVAKSNDIQFVPTRLILVGRNDGSGYVDPVKMLRSFDVLNQDFEDQNVRFYISEIDYLDRTNYYDHENSSTGRIMMVQNNKRGVVNNYIVGNPAGNCGYYFGGTADAIAMGINCMGSQDRTWSHELGHYLSLPHTFYGWESVGEIDEIPSPAPATVRYRGEDVPVEKVDGSNCEEAADGFCDTAPDYLMQRWRCERGDIYRDSLMDPDSMSFVVSGNNVMSYALDDCVEGFTDDQQGAMLTNLAGRGFADDSGMDETEAEGEDLLLVSPANNARLEFSDNAVLSWTPVENADYYVVQVNRNSTNFNGTVTFSTIVTDTTITMTDLDPEIRYFWRVRPVNRYYTDSDFGDQVWRFRNGEFTTSTIDAELNAAITVAPNPVGAGQELRIAGQDLSVNGDLTIELVDASGRVLQRRDNLRVTSAGFRESLPTANLPNGVYFLRLQLADKLVTRRVVIL